MKILQENYFVQELIQEVHEKQDVLLGTAEMRILLVGNRTLTQPYAANRQLEVQIFGNWL